MTGQTAENGNTVRSVGVVGAGTMGAAIAQSAVLSGIRAVLYDVAPQALERARQRVQDSLERSVAAGRLATPTVRATLSRLSFAESINNLGSCDLLIEAVVENEAVKHRVLADLSAAAPRAVIATNTSSCKVADLAPSVADPARFLGLHYFFPAHINPLVEVVRGPATADYATEVAEGFARVTGKRPILCRDGYGFAINRYFVPYLNEAARLFGEGLATGVVDAAAREAFGTPAGPFKVMNLTGPAVAFHAMTTLSRLGPAYTPAESLEAIARSGGLWDIEEDAQPTAAEAERVEMRLKAAVLGPVREILDEGIARPEDLDLGARIGLHWTWQPCAALRAEG